jgi:hypothetical protein
MERDIPTKVDDVAAEQRAKRLERHLKLFLFMLDLMADSIQTMITG